MNTESINHQIKQADALPEPSLAELFGRVADDLKLLTRQELQLASHELNENLMRAKREGVALALGGAALGAGALVLLAALVLVLGLLMPVWLAALLVGGCFTAAGAVVFLRARAKLSEVQLMPERTIQNVQRDVAAIKGAAT